MRTRLNRLPEAEPRASPKPQLGDFSLVCEAADPVALEEVGVVHAEDAIISAAGRKAVQVFFIRTDVAVVLRRVLIALYCPVGFVLDVPATALLHHLLILLAQRVR